MWFDVLNIVILKATLRTVTGAVDVGSAVHPGVDASKCKPGKEAAKCKAEEVVPGQLKKSEGCACHKN